MTVGGVDVGGMDAAEAEAGVRHQLLAPLQHSLRVGYDGESWKLHGKSLKVHADLDAAVEEALDASRDGGLPGRLVRYVTGGSVDKQISRRRHLLEPAVNRFVRQVADEVDREAAGRRRSNRAATRSKSSPAKNGRKLRDNLLTRQIDAAVLNADADHTIAARTHSIEAGGDAATKSPPSTRPT